MGSVDTESLFRAFLRKNITLRTGTLHELETVRLSEASQHFPAVASRGLVGGARRNPQGLGEGILPEGRTAACTGKGIPPPPPQLQRATASRWGAPRRLTAQRAAQRSSSRETRTTVSLVS